jgi:hypothetical protein
MVEGDHRGSGAPRLGYGDQVLEQIGVPTVHPIEDADDDEDRPELRAERFDPVDDVHRDVRRRGRPGGRTAGQALSRSRPLAADAIHQTRRILEAVALGSPGNSPGRTN